MSNKVTDDEYDDCPLCRLMKKQEKGEKVTNSDIIKATKEAEKQGGIIGGPLMDRDKKLN